MLKYYTFVNAAVNCWKHSVSFIMFKVPDNSPGHRAVGNPFPKPTSIEFLNILPDRVLVSPSPTVPGIPGGIIPG